MADTLPALAQGNTQGSWSTSPTFTGGLSTPEGSTPESYYGYGNSYGTGTDPNGCESNSGSLTATFTWSGSTPAPPTIVEQQATASWFADDCPFAASGSCADGLGDPSLAPMNPPEDDYGETSAGTSYSVPSAQGNSLSVTLSGASSSVDALALELAEGGAGCDVNWAVTTYPVTITLSGAPTTTDGTATGPPEAMAGEQITANLVGLPPGCTVASYAWSTSGGSPFENYNYNLASNQQVSLSAADVAARAFKFYDAGNDKVYVSCTAVVQPPTPSGGTAPPTFTVTAISQPITFIKPTFDIWTINHGYVQNTGSYIMRLAATSAIPNGEDWSNVTMTFPANLPSYLVGRWGCFVQLDKPDYTYTPVPTNPDPLNNIQGLDTNFPLQDAGGHIAEWSLTGTPGSPTSASPDDGDSPGIGGSSGNLTQIMSNESFTTWVMYQPASFTPSGGVAQGVIWVPIASYQWSWSGTATLTNHVWTLSNFSPFSSGQGPAATATAVYPTWTCVHTN